MLESCIFFWNNLLIISCQFGKSVCSHEFNLLISMLKVWMNATHHKLCENVIMFCLKHAPIKKKIAIFTYSSFRQKRGKKISTFLIKRIYSTY